MLRKIVSGGQTGADQGGLEAAKYLGLETGGWAPLGWLVEKGTAKALQEGFGLREWKHPGYPARTQQNVTDSDATLAFRFHYSRGTDATISYAQKREFTNTDVNIR